MTDPITPDPSLARRLPPAGNPVWPQPITIDGPLAEILRAVAAYRHLTAEKFIAEVARGAVEHMLADLDVL